jgi:hypothetical protein
MAIYWCDPYINAPIGGIHGTTSTTIRNGTYESPFNFYDICSNTNSINGVTLLDGDEIRLKGLAFNDFLYDTGTPNKKISVTRNAYYRKNVISAHQTGFNNWLNTLSNKRGVIVAWDNNLIGDNKFTFAQTALSSTSAVVSGAPSQYFPLSGYWSAVDSQDISCVDKNYCISYTQIDNTGRYVLSAKPSSGVITYTDGWTSSTTRGGHTLLAFNTFSTNRYFGNNNISTSTRIVYNCPSTHIIYFSTSADFTNGTLQMLGVGFCPDGTTQTIGSIIDHSNTTWNYFYKRSAASYNGEFIIGNVGTYYTFIYPSGATLNTAKFTIRNYFSGISPYHQWGDSSNVQYGNMFIYTQYTGNALIYGGGGSASAKISFLNGAYIYGFNGTLGLTTQFNGSVSFDGVAYNYLNTEVYPNPLVQFNTGPVYGGTITASGQAFNGTFKLSASNWTERVVVDAGLTLTYNYTIPGEINMAVGLLDCQGVDYRTSNAGFLVKHSTYSGISYYSSINVHFLANTYDNNTVGALTRNITDMNAHFPMLCYNDNNGDLVVQCNSNAVTGATYKKSSIFKIPSKAGKTTLNMSCEVQLSSNFSGHGVNLLLNYLDANAGTFASIIGSSFNSSTSTYSFTFTTPLTNVHSSAYWIGLSFNLTNAAGGYINKYTIKNVNVTTT